MLIAIEELNINLANVMRGMSLEEDVPVIIPKDEEAYCAMERGGRSLLNPECLNMDAENDAKNLEDLWSS